jgi:membrane protein DedA with SNARE-associated domain
MATRLEHNHTRWLVVSALGCFVGSVQAALLGILLTTGWVVNEELHPLLHALGFLLLVMAIPILIAGGHCLDLLEKRRENTGNPDNLHRLI